MKKQDLAKLINVSRNTITNWEKEKPELIKLIKLGLQVENHFDNNIPKEYIEKKLDSKNIFNERRKEEILKFFNLTSLEQFKYIMLKWIEFEEIHTYELPKIKKANSKYNILYQFKELLKEYKNNQHNYKQLLININDELKFDFNTNDIDIINHIVTRYKIYEKLYNLDNEEEIELEIISTLTNKQYNKYFIEGFIKIFINKFGIETVEKALNHYRGTYEEEIYKTGIEKIEYWKTDRNIHG